MRKLSFALAFTVSTVGLATASLAATLDATGTLALRISTLPPVEITRTTSVGVNASGGGGHLESLTVPASPFEAAGVVVPVTDPFALPIAGVLVTAHNAAGNFSGGQVGGPGPGGPMSIQGVAKVCLFAPCSERPPANIDVPLSVVGVGGSVTVEGPVNLTVQGAPWTEGTASIGISSVQGFAHGPASATSSAAQASGVVRLVTPIFISTQISSLAVVPAFGLLTLHFVPEPGTLMLLGSGIAGLVMLGRSRRVERQR